MLLRLAGILAAVLLGAVAVSAEETAKKEQESLQGAWAVLWAEHDGHKTPAEKVQAVKLVIAGDKLTVRGDKGMESTIKLDPAKKPKTIDITPGDGPDKGKVLQGIYEVKGDELKLCLSKPGKDRPTEFVSKENSGIILMLLKREKS